MKEKGCASPEHSPSCPCPACRKPRQDCIQCPKLTIQHVIPKCIGKKILHLSDREIESYTQMESRACHRMNDPLIGKVFEEMMKLKRSGTIFIIQDVLNLREAGAFKKH